MPSAAKLQALSQQTAAVANEPSASQPPAQQRRPRPACRHPECPYMVHSDPELSVWFCCEACRGAYMAVPLPRPPEHGRRCQRERQR